MDSKESMPSFLPTAAAIAGLWLLLAGCGGEAVTEAEQTVAMDLPQAQAETRPAKPAKSKRNPAETIEWRDGRFATVWDPGD